PGKYCACARMCSRVQRRVSVATAASRTLVGIGGIGLSGKTEEVTSEEVARHPVPHRAARLGSGCEGCVRGRDSARLSIVRCDARGLRSDAPDRGWARPWQGGSKGPPCRVSPVARGSAASPSGGGRLGSPVAGDRSRQRRRLDSLELLRLGWTVLAL